MESSPISAFESVGVAFGEERIYDRLSFDVRRGEFVCILGPSGCGKSTSLRIIGGLLDVSSGRITVDERAPRDAWSDIAFVFQSPRLVPWRTALDNVLLGSELRFGGGDRERRKARAAELLSLVGLAGERIPSPSTLTLPSWGMLLQAARRAVRPRPDGALSGGVDFRDASDHAASADTRTPCMAPSRRQRLVSVILVASARLNSRENKDKSERLVTGFVRVPGMCEARPRYRLSRQLGTPRQGWRAGAESGTGAPGGRGASYRDARTSIPAFRNIR